MAGGEALANLDADIEAYEETHGGHPPPPAA
jgi:simple sugar transport system ATP-binding protein